MPPRRHHPRKAIEEVTPEDAVREYLEYLVNPAAFDDSGQADALRHRAAETHDVLERLALLRDARQAKYGVEPRLREQFVRLARVYADAEGLVAEDFRAAGVPGRVLTEAGLVTGGRRGRSRTPRAARAEQRRDLSAIRAWARANGYQVSDRGRIPASVLQAYGEG